MSPEYSLNTGEFALTGLSRRIFDLAPKPWPCFGSASWARLAVDDPRRFAAVLVAAESWRHYCHRANVAADAAEHLDAQDRAVIRRLSEAAWDVSSVHRAEAARRREVASVELLGRQMAREHMNQWCRRAAQAIGPQRPDEEWMAWCARATTALGRTEPGTERKAS